jgi:hypothetical protein
MNIDHKPIATRSPEWKANISKGLKLAYQQGKMTHAKNQTPEFIAKRTHLAHKRRHSPETKAKQSAIRLGKPLAESAKSKLRSMYQNGFVQYLSATSEQQRRRAISVSRLGTHGYGRSKRDNENHCRAKLWRVRDPMGRIHSFQNACKWARANEHLFLPYDAPNSKLPLWKRFVSGLNSMQRTDDKGTHHWRGWMLVGSWEQTKTLLE